MLLIKLYFSVFFTSFKLSSGFSLLNQAMRNKPELNSAPCPQTHLDAVNKNSQKFILHQKITFPGKEFFFTTLNLCVCTSSVLLGIMIIMNDFYYTSFEKSTTIIKLNIKTDMCSSRKHPYPPLWKFQFIKLHTFL